MKKTNKLFSILIAITCIIFSGCFNPIFYEIRKDVEPEPTTVKSPVNNITRFTVSGEEFLVICSDEGIRYKRADSSGHDEWKTFGNVPFSLHSYNFEDSSHDGVQLVGIYASSDTLYALTAKYSVDEDLGVTYPSKISLWGTSSAGLVADGASWGGNVDWKEIISDTKNEYFPMYYYNDYYYSAFDVFQTNSIKNADRKVFIRRGNTSAKSTAYQKVTYFELSGTNTPTPFTPFVEDCTDQADSNVRSAVAFNGTTLFFNSYAATTNETKDFPATYFYYGDGENIMYGTASGSVTKALGVGKKVSALAVCKDALLIGCANFTAASSSSTSGGIYKTTITDGVPGSGLADFSTNAQFQISAAYYVTALLNATPERNETDSYLYCATQIYGVDSSSSAIFDNVGLWSYYPGRGNWNRE